MPSVRDLIGTLTGPVSQEDVVPLGPTLRSLGVKRLSARRGDRPRDLSVRVPRGAIAPAISAYRPGAVQRAYDAVSDIGTGGLRDVVNAFEGLTGANEFYNAGVRGISKMAGADPYAGDTDLQSDDALTIGLNAGAAPAFKTLGVIGRLAGHIAPEWAAGAGRAIKRFVTDARAPVDDVESLVSRDIPRDHVMSLTPEETPGANTGHRSDVTNGSLSVRSRYSDAAPWTRRTQSGDPYDVMYSAQGIRQRPVDSGAGAYVNSNGGLEINPVRVVQPEVGREPSPDMLARLDATENLRGLLDAQEFMAGNKPVEDAAGKGLLFDMPSQPDYVRMGRTARALNGEGDFGFTATSRGGMLFPFEGGDIAPGDVPKYDAMLGRLADIYPGSTAVPVRNEGFFRPALNSWDGATPPNSGAATIQTLSQLADAPADVAMSLSSSPAFADVVRSKIARDAGMPGTREDLQNTRQLFAGEDWRHAVELMRKGVSPAAALAAVGYSTSALASDGR